MSGRIALLLLLIATPATAQTVFDRAAGIYGSADDPALSCSANPHRLDFSARPPHAIFTWAHPFIDRAGQSRRRARYDVLDFDATSITLRMEGETRHRADGDPVIWLLRLAPDASGYCWGRTDWPIPRCVAPAVRCANPAPAS